MGNINSLLLHPEVCNRNSVVLGDSRGECIQNSERSISNTIVSTVDRGTMIQSTSLEAYNDIRDSLGERQKLVYNTIKSAKRPVCNQEIADYLRKPINTITPRVNELVKLELVIEAGREIYPPTNRRVIFWKLK